jgi:hypothetical protein
MAAVKHILRYVAGTYNWGLWFGRKGNEIAQLIGFSDSDYAGDIDKRQSTTGVIFLLDSSPVLWQSIKQKVIAQSSCEAEYIATVNATCQALWIARVLAEIQGTELGVPLLKVDNQSAIALIKNPVLTGQSQHIEVEYHLVQESAAKGQIEVEFIGTENQLADIFTKSLGKTRFQELRAKVGLIDFDSQHNKV